MSWIVPPAARDGAPEVLTEIAARLQKSPFSPAPGMAGGHRQTAIGSQVGGGQLPELVTDAVALPDGAAVQVFRGRQDLPRRLILVHGMGGDLRSTYMRSLARGALGDGWGVTLIEHYNAALETVPRVFHAASGEVIAAVAQAELHRGAERLVVAGVSLGANVVLSAVADWGAAPPPGVAGAVVLSPLVDLVATWPFLERPSNRGYVMYFLDALKRRVRAQEPLLTPHIDVAAALGAPRVRDFDSAVVVPLGGFADVWDYYDRASAGPRLGAARLPVVLLHAADDPIIPFAPLLREPLRSAPSLLVAVTAQGGHGGFFDRRLSRWGDRALLDAAGVLLRG